MKIKHILKNIKNKILAFFLDDSAGSLVEYALLIGFALFIFFIIIGIVSSMLDWTVGLSNDFFDLINNPGN
ncbi:MAG: hypothetical protein GF317_02035 [Candidatus Lokiarchaeota archaeon]|nr:hypothetical protein [Candidatus Lokiarchaeota archaeon]MBD3198719.1 hypothetical protein [Candidatus Lokiarchaeota archaeon]